MKLTAVEWLVKEIESKNLKTSKMKERKYYWTQKNGQKIDVDLMDLNHLRNTLKLIIRNLENLKVKKSVVNESKGIGDIEANFLEDEYNEYIEDYYDEF